MHRIPSFFVRFASRAGLFCKLHHNAVRKLVNHQREIVVVLIGSHKGFAIEIVQSIFCILVEFRWTNFLHSCTIVRPLHFRIQQSRNLTWSDKYKGKQPHSGYIPVITRTSTIRPYPSKNLDTSSERVSGGSPVDNVR